MLNQKFRWVKYCLSDKGGLSAEDDAVVDESSVGEECMQLVQRMGPSWTRAIPSS